MSIVGIRNGLYHLFTASGPWSSAQVSTCTFDVLESTSGCALTYLPEGTSEIEPLTFDTFAATVADKRSWRIGGTLWIRDVGDPTAVLGGIWQGYDDLYATLKKDVTLSGSCQFAHLTQVTQRLDQFREAGGHLWKPVDWVVIAEEF